MGRERRNIYNNKRKQEYVEDEMVICIQYCGGCNPVIDRGGVAAALRAALAGEDLEWVVNRPAEADMIVYLSGCNADCARRYNEAGRPGVSVAGAGVDGLAVPAAALAAAVAGRLRVMFEERRRQHEP